jgi:hypothetical protein
VTYRDDLAPPRVRPRRHPFVPLACLLLVSGLSMASVAHAGEPSPPGSGAERAESVAAIGEGRAAMRAEARVARMLVRLDDELDLKTFPDASPDWPLRLAASIEARADGAPGQDLLRRIAVELRRLGDTWTLGEPIGNEERGRPVAGTAAGRERIEIVRALEELSNRLVIKLGLVEAPEGTRASAVAPPTGLGPKIYFPGADSCGAAQEIGLDIFEGYTSGADNDGDASCAGPVATPDVWYRFIAPEAGAYAFETDDYYGDSFDTVLSLHHGCPDAADLRELACSDDAAPGDLTSSIHHVLAEGQQVWIRVSGYGGATGYYRLTVSLERTIEGRVTRASDGSPVEGATVAFSTDSFGTFVYEGMTGSDGTYAVAVPRSTVAYHGRASDPRFVSQLWNGVDCNHAEECDFWPGDDISVETGDVTGIDFALSPGGGIAGSVVGEDTGNLPDYSTYLYLYDDQDSIVESFRITGDGDFEIQGLPVGEYRIRAQASGYRDELWNDLYCPFPCDTTTGDPVVVTAGAITSGLDIALDRLGEIQGKVVQASDGQPVPSERVLAYEDDGSYAGSGFTNNLGEYSIRFLTAGDHYVRTDADLYLDELYDGLPCEAECDVTTGAPVTVQYNTPAQGIDFELAPKSTLSGTATDALSGEPVFVRIFLYDASGDYVADSSVSPQYSLTYRFEALDAGTYYLRAGYDSYYGEPTHIGELYGGAPCPTTCDPTAGTPVDLGASENRTGLDFELDRRGSITGRITRSGSGLPIESNVWARAYQDGVLINDGYVEPDGSYEIPSLLPGSYRVGTSSAVYDEEVFDDVECGSPCDRTLGEPVQVQKNAATPGIDFEVDRLGSIAGNVFDAETGSQIPRSVQLYESDGTPSWFGSTSYGTPFAFHGLEAGTYYVRADGGTSWDDVAYQSEVYSDLACEPDCDETTGTPIVVPAGAEITGIDLYLARCPFDSHTELSSTVVTGYLKTLACDRITAQDVTFASGSSGTLRSGRSVMLGNGFIVEEGANLEVIIVPEWGADDP